MTCTLCDELCEPGEVIEREFGAGRYQFICGACLASMNQEYRDQHGRIASCSRIWLRRKRIGHWTNNQAAEKLALLGDLLELVDNEPFKARAHHNAARTLKGLGEYFGDLVGGGDLAGVPGFGKAIVTKLEELHTSGNLAELDTLLTKVPSRSPSDA